MIVIGTAGHIDHGKSSIVRRLTGTDPDRLPEEKARGMTIDLGFAFYEPNDSTSIAFVDVPGHERFVRNMIAGAGGIDAALLVVAADDGWMPQSQEHFQILRLLGVKHGLVVINKIDLVEPDWLELLTEEVKEKVSGSFLADAPIVAVSSETGAGFDSLSEHLVSLASKVDLRKDFGKSRLFIDRSFVRPGIGGVVTGTLRGGALHVGQQVTLWPGLATGKIRTLQSASEDVETALPGQRTAVSFTGIDREHLVRGGAVLTGDVERFRDNPVLALSLEMLPESPLPLEDRREITILVGTSEASGEARIFDRAAIGPGENGIIYFRPDQPVHSLVGDRVIVRLPTPMVTLGGGTVLDQLSRFPRRKEMPRFEYLAHRLPVTPLSLVESELMKLIVAGQGKLLDHADLGADEIDEATTELLERGLLAEVDGSLYHVAEFEKSSKHITMLISNQLAANSHLPGLLFEFITRRIDLNDNTLRRVLGVMIARRTLTYTKEMYNLVGRSVELKGIIKQVYDEIVKEMKDSPSSGLGLSQLAARGKNHQHAIKFLLDSGECYKIGSEFIMLSEKWQELVEHIRDELNRTGELAVSALRDRFGLTRKFAIPILEETDRIGLTERQGDVRVKGDRFEE